MQVEDPTCMQSEYTTISKLILRASNKVNARRKIAHARWRRASRCLLMCDGEYALTCSGGSWRGLQTRSPPKDSMSEYYLAQGPTREDHLMLRPSLIQDIRHARRFGHGPHCQKPADIAQFLTERPSLFPDCPRALRPVVHRPSSPCKRSISDRDR